MKTKNVTKTVKCEMCDNSQVDKSEFRAPHWHTMIVVSVWEEENNKRRYMDFCSKECVARWCNAKHHLPELEVTMETTTNQLIPDTLEPSALWAVMKAHTWGSVTTASGIPLTCPPEGPHGFIPLFTTREQAVAWAGSDEYVAMLMPNGGR